MEVYKGYTIYQIGDCVDIQSILNSKYILGVVPRDVDDKAGITYIKEYIDDSELKNSKLVRIENPSAVSINNCCAYTWNTNRKGTFYVVYYTKENSNVESATILNCIAVPIGTINNPTVKEDKTMGNVNVNVNESFKAIMSMKMLSVIMKDDKQDLGKLFLMQQMMNGETLTVTDVIKSKLIKQFDLSDNSKELSVEKVMLLQMLQEGTVDLGQLIQFKLMQSFLEEGAEDLLNV